MPSRAKAQKLTGVNEVYFRMLSDPTRYGIMVVLTETQTHPAEIARLLELPLKNVAHHVEVLREAGMIEEVGTTNRRGGTAHIYKAVARPMLDLSAWEALPRIDRDVISTADLQRIIDDAVAAQRANTIEARPNRTMIRVPLRLDDEGLGEVEEAAEELLRRALKAEANSAERSAEEGAECFNATASVLAFEVPSGL